MFYFGAGSRYETRAVIGCSRCLQTEADVMEWSDEKTFSLIALYEKHVCLYDVQNKDYHIYNRNVKKRAIEYLSTELGANGWCFDLSLLFVVLLVLFMGTVAGRCRSYF